MVGALLSQWSSLVASSLSVSQCVSQQKQDKENRWAWAHLGVELLFHSVVWSFDVFWFCVFSAVPNSNVDSEITLVHVGHSVVEVVHLFAGFACTSLLGLVSVNVLLILSAKKQL